jgi:putative membrane protein
MSKGIGNMQQSLTMMGTDLANERTLLAYGTTTLMSTATGVTLNKFFSMSHGLHAMGWLLGCLGLAIGLLGVTRFAKMQRGLQQQE